MHKQQGMTFIGMLLATALIIAAGLVIMRIVPVYLEYYEVVKSVSNLNDLPASEFTEDPSTNATVLKSKLLYQLFINGIQVITPEQIILVPNGDTAFKLTVKYRTQRHLVYNITLLFDFETTQEVKIRAE